MPIKKQKPSFGLKNASPEKCFWVCNGQILKNLQELAESLEKMSENIFRHHVNAMKNDFARWIEDVFGDKKLASEVKKAKTPKSAAQKVKTKL